MILWLGIACIHSIQTSKRFKLFFWGSANFTGLSTTLTSFSTHLSSFASTYNLLYHFLLLLLLSAGLATATESQYHKKIPAEFSFSHEFFEKAGAEDAIPYNLITAIAQDRQGFLWIGSQGGLLRYDGYRFKKYTHRANDPSSLPSDYVKSLLATADGKICVGSISEGMACLDPVSEKFKQFHPDQSKPESISPGVIFGFAEDHHGGIWVIGDNTGLDYLVPDSQKFLHFRHQPNMPASLLTNRVYSALVDRHGTLWVGMKGGLQKLPYGSQNFETVASDPASPSSLSAYEVRTIFEAEDGKIWLGLNHNRAAWLDPEKHQLHVLKELHTETQSVPLKHLKNPAKVVQNNEISEINIIVQPHSDEIWLSNYSHGIIVVAASDGHFIKKILHDAAIPSSLGMNTIGAMKADRSGIVWLGTWGAGLQKYTPNHASIRMLRHSPANPAGLSTANIRSILELKDGLILAGTDGNGIDIIDRKQGLIGGYRPQKNRSDSIAECIMALSVSQDGSLWAGTRHSGVQRLSPNSSGWQNFDTQDGLPSMWIRRLFTTKDERLWVGSTLGVSRWDPVSKKFEVFTDQQGTPMGSYVTSFAEDQQGNLWIGSENGLWLYQPGARVLTNIRHQKNDADSLISDQVSGLLIDHLNRLWVDTDHGLDQLISRDGSQAKFEHISELAGKPGLYMGANLLEDQAGKIWTQWYRYDPKTIQLSQLSKANGIDLGTAWLGAYTATRDGYFLYGGTQGMAIIHPERFRPLVYKAPIVLTELKIDGIITSLSSLHTGLQLKPSQRNFDLEFSSLDFSQPAQTRYAYRLLGYQSEWIETDASHRNASYGNLWAGQYTLQIRATNSAGEWGNQPLSISIVVLPAFWQTTWFILLSIAGIFTTLYAGYRWRLGRMRKEAVKLQSLIDMRTADVLKLGEIGQSLTATLDTEQAFCRIHQQVCARLDAHVFAIATCNEQKNTIQLDYVLENGVRQQAVEFSMHEIHTPAVWCVSQKQELITTETSELLNFISQIAPVRCGQPTESIIYLPLILEQKVIGCMTVQSLKKSAYSNDQIEFLRALASYTAIAVANAQSHKHLLDTQQQLAQQEKLASLGQLVANVAHEINTPIGAIKSSGKSISDSLHYVMSDLSELMQILNTDQRELFQKLLQQINLSQTILNTREERKLVREITASLEHYAIAEPRHLANILLQLNVHANVADFLPLLNHQDCKRIFSTAGGIAAILHSSNNINLAVERVSKIVFAFKAFSRSGKNFEQNHKVLAKLQDGIQTVLTLYQNQIIAGTELICQFQEIPEILCWPDELVQIWANLIHNALQAMNYQGKLKISIEKINQQAVIRISDTGCGIPESIQSKIFEVFFTTKPIGEGSGLGLDIVQKIIKKHQGSIEFESKVGAGTTFTVRLPYT